MISVLPDLTYLVFVDGSDAVDRQGDSILLPRDDDLVLRQAGRRDADACARLLAQLLHQSVVGTGDEGVEGLLQRQTLHGSLVLARRAKEGGGGGGSRQTRVEQTAEFVNIGFHRY